MWSESGSQSEEERKATSGFFLGIYLVLGITSVTMIFVRNMSFVKISVKSSRRLHHRIFQSVLMCPLSFFDTTPVGRITGRFSKDMNGID